MTRHSVAFEIERPVPAAEAAKELLPPTQAKASAGEPAAASVQPKSRTFARC